MGFQNNIQALGQEVDLNGMKSIQIPDSALSGLNMYNEMYTLTVNTFENLVVSISTLS